MVMADFPKLPEDKLLRRLAPPRRPVRIVLDTDTFNEIDDQFAVVYAMKSPERLRVEACYAAPFHNKFFGGPRDGMEKSYDELLKIRSRLPDMAEVPLYRGSGAYLPGPDTPVDSEAARDLVERAMASPDNDPLYVVAIGAITNVASALLLEPRIIDKIVVVWLGGHALHWPTTREFNLAQDLHATRTVLNCGVPLVLIPCLGVASHLLTTLSEMRDFVKDKGAIGAYLYETFENCSADHFGYSRVMWDLSAVAYLIDDSWLPHELTHSPLVSEEFRWSFDASRHLIRYVRHIHRDRVFKDLFAKLGKAAADS